MCVCVCVSACFEMSQTQMVSPSETENMNAKIDSPTFENPPTSDMPSSEAQALSLTSSRKFSYAPARHRSRKFLRNNILSITKPSIRRLARRGGVKRISGQIYEETRGVLTNFIDNIVRDATTYMQHANRKTVTALDVVYALKLNGKTLYGAIG